MAYYQQLNLGKHPESDDFISGTRLTVVRSEETGSCCQHEIHSLRPDACRRRVTRQQLQDLESQLLILEMRIQHGIVSTL